MNTEELTSAYGLAQRRWRGCDWPTNFEGRGLDLCGISAVEARRVAESGCGSESAIWQRAAQWLKEIEDRASQAEYEACIAHDLAKSGHPGFALDHAAHAVDFAAQHGREEVWLPLFRAIERMLEGRGSSEESPLSASVGATEPVIFAWTIAGESGDNVSSATK